MYVKVTKESVKYLLERRRLTYTVAGAWKQLTHTSGVWKRLTDQREAVNGATRRRLTDHCEAVNGPLTPAKGHGSRAIGAFLDQRLVELAAGPAVDGRPALLAVVLNTNIKHGNIFIQILCMYVCLI